MFYFRNIGPGDSVLVSALTLGEGQHNYHHTFPWDFRGAAPGTLPWNFTLFFILTCAKIGWAYEMKAPSDDTVKKRAARTGEEIHLWGWGDKDIEKVIEDYKSLNKI